MPDIHIRLRKLLIDDIETHGNDWRKLRYNLHADLFEYLGSPPSQKMAYDLLYPNEDVAPCGFLKSFSGFTVGYRSCGPTNKCACAKRLVADSVSKTKLSKSTGENEAINTKRRETVVGKYGVDNVFQLPEVIATHLNVTHSDEANRKRTETNLHRYGGNPSKNEVIREKIENTNLIRYGTKSVLSNKEVISKIRSTSLERYGVTNPIQTKEVQMKIRATNMERYGVTNPSYSPMIKEKIQRSWWNRPNMHIRYQENYVLLDEYTGARDHYRFLCKKCGNCFFDTLISGQSPLCRVCTPYGTSFELELTDYLQNDLKCLFSTHDRSIIAPKELDFVIKTKNIAIEFNGLYWHSEMMVGQSYHLDKLTKCESKGYRLIHIFEDEWIHKKSIIESRLRHIVGMSDQRIMARKCEIVDVSPVEAATFLDAFHLQGACHSSIRFGLRYQNKLIALATFSKIRFGAGNAKTWELVRFCCNEHVVGGASRLFKHFIKTIDPDQVMSYADRRWSDGHLYYNLGFSLIGKTKPNYWYFKAKKRYHRLRFTKQKLIKNGGDPSLTERQIMENSGYNRIYDCGSLKFLWSKE